MKNIPKWLISIITHALIDISRRKFAKMNDKSGCIKDQGFAQNNYNVKKWDGSCGTNFRQHYFTLGYGLNDRGNMFRLKSVARISEPAVGPTLLPIKLVSSCLSPVTKWMVCESDHWFSSIAEENKWGCTSAVPYVFMTRKVTLWLSILTWRIIYFLLFCTMTNKCTLISQIITLLHVSTLSCRPQGACKQYLAKLHKYRGDDESLARPGRKQATAIEDFDFHISYL